jgi:hypothetical protein
MKKDISTPAVVAIIVVVVLLVAGFGWYSMNRETPLRGELRAGSTPAHLQRAGGAGGTGRGMMSAGPKTDVP